METPAHRRHLPSLIAPPHRQSSASALGSRKPRQSSSTRNTRKEDQSHRVICARREKVTYYTICCKQLFCSLGISGLRFESLVLLYSTTISGQACSLFLKTFSGIFLSRKFCAPPSNRERYSAKSVREQKRRILLFSQ